MWRLEEAKAQANNTGPAQLLHRCLRKSTKVSRAWGKRRAAKKQQREKVLRQQLAQAQLLLHLDPQDSLRQHQLHAAEEAIHALDKEKATWLNFIMQARWLSNDSKTNKILFKSFKKMSVDTEINQVFDAHGVLQENWENIATTAKLYYANLLGTQHVMDQTAVQQVMENMHDTISPTEREQLEQPLTLEELFSAVSSLSKNKVQVQMGSQSNSSLI